MSQKLIAILTFCCCLFPVVNAAIIPVDLNPGDKFHYIFLTNSRTDATSGDINFYNNFVTIAGQGESVGGGFNLSTTNFFAIASTVAVDARDNIGNVTAPIYLLDGTRSVNNEADLFDSSLGQRIAIDDTGANVTERVWSGTDEFGQGIPGIELGQANSGFGDSLFTDASWIKFGNIVNTNTYTVYGISEELTVTEPVPEPSFIIVLFLTVVGFVWRRKYLA